MSPLLALARAFINFFGITRPTPANERRAAWFIAALLAVVVVAAAAFFLLFLRVRTG